jgi:hypothetical protein
MFHFVVDSFILTYFILKEPVIKKESKPTSDASKPAQLNKQAESSLTNDLKKLASGGIKAFHFLF